MEQLKKLQVMHHVPQRNRSHHSSFNVTQITQRVDLRQRHERHLQVHQNSWLCSLITPKVFFVSLYLITIGFWSITGMTCGGKISSRCPSGVLQAFSIFQQDGGTHLRNAMTSNKWEEFDPPNFIILIFSWFSITASSLGLFAFRRTYHYARHGRYTNGQLVLRVYPLYLLLPSLFGYFCTFLLLFFWTFYVVEDQIDIANMKVGVAMIVNFILLTLFPLITIWAGFFYVTYGLVRSIFYMHILLDGWNDPPPPPQRMASFNLNSSGKFASPPSPQSLGNPPSTRASIRRLGNGIVASLSLKNKESCVLEPLNPLDTTNGSVRSQKLESILEVPER